MSSDRPGALDARDRRPPGVSSFSYTVTSWPWRAKLRAQASPAGPAPATITLIGFSEGVILPAWYSRPTCGLTTQEPGSRCSTAWMHPRQHPRQGRMRENSPLRAFSGRSGSASSGRPMATMSADLSEMNRSAIFGSLIRPTATTGMDTVSLTAFARGTKHPCRTYMDGMVSSVEPYTPADTWR